MAAGHKDRCCIKKRLFCSLFLFAEDYRTMRDIWVARGTVFRQVRPGDGFKTGDFVHEKLGELR